MEKEYRLLNPSNQIFLTMKLGATDNCESVECFGKKPGEEDLVSIEPPWGKALVFFDTEGSGEVLTVSFPSKNEATKKIPVVRRSKLPLDLSGSPIADHASIEIANPPFAAEGLKPKTLIDLHDPRFLNLFVDQAGAYAGVGVEDGAVLPQGRTSYALDYETTGRFVYTVAFPGDGDTAKIRLGKKEIPDDETLINSGIAAPMAEPVEAKNAASVYTLPVGTSLAVPVKVARGATRTVQIGDMEHNLIMVLGLGENNQCASFSAGAFSLPQSIAGFSLRRESVLPYGQTRLFNTDSGELVLLEFPKPLPGMDLGEYKPVVRGVWPEGKILEAVSYFRESADVAAAPAKADKREIADGAFVQAVLKYTVNLTEQAQSGQLDPFVGRDDILQKAEKALLQRQRMNAVFVGPPGVGKTALVEGLAQRFADGAGHDGVGDVMFLRVNIGKVLSDVTPPVSTPSSVLRPLFEGLSERGGVYHDQDGHEKHVVLVLDGVTELLENQHYDNFGSFLRPYLSGGRIRCLPAATEDQYEKLVGKDSSLGSCINKIVVPAPSRAKVLEILESKRSLYEKKHGITISDDMLELIYDTGAHHLHILNEPRRSESVLDGAAAQAQHKGADTLLPAHVFAEIAELANLDAGFVSLSLKERMAELEKIKQEDIFGQDDAVDEIVAGVQSNMTGLTDPDKPLGAFMILGPRGVGKTELAYALARRLFGAKSGEDASDQRDVERSKVVKLDMAKFKEEHTASGLFGTSAGYVGFNEPGAAEMLSKVKENPSCVLLLDEIEKAHPVVFQSILHILDKGEATDYHGNKISFRNVVLLMAGNLGSAEAEEAGEKAVPGFGSDASQDAGVRDRNIYLAELKRRTSPEFRDRLDGTVIFSKLNEVSVKRVLDKKITAVGEQLRRNTRGIRLKDVTFEVPEDVRSALVGKHFDPKAGSARAVVRIGMRKEVAGPLGKWVVEHGDTILPGSTLKLTGLGDAFNIQVMQPAIPVLAARRPPALAAARLAGGS